ncbi:hypothetical protein Tco_0531217 [Tanacetum coccineum]
MRKKDYEIRLSKRKFAQVRCDASHGKGASQRTTIGVSDSSLMDDFVVMEKLAIVSIDTCNLDSIGIKLVSVAEGDAWKLRSVTMIDKISKLLNDDWLLATLLWKSHELRKSLMEQEKKKEDPLLQKKEAISKGLSALIVGLEDKSYCCEELEATCLDLQLQLASDLIKIR